MLPLTSAFYPTPQIHLLISGAPGSSFSLVPAWPSLPPKEPLGSSWSQSTLFLLENGQPLHGLAHLPALPPPCPPQESQGGRGSSLLRKLPQQLLCHSIQRLLPGWKVLCDYAWLPINRNLSAPAAFILASSFSPFGETIQFLGRSSLPMCTVLYKFLHKLTNDPHTLSPSTYSRMYLTD